MVFHFDEADFHRRWRWFCRPHQRIGMSVGEYCARFHDWREEMISLSFPAAEEDYSDEFINNLREDIRLRISKHGVHLRRLSEAFSAAKIEDATMCMEEARKKIDALMVFDKMPSRSCVDKFQQDELKNFTCNGFDKAAKSTRMESSTITKGYPQVLGNDNCNSSMGTLEPTRKRVLGSPLDDVSMGNGKSVEEVLESEEKSCYDVNTQRNDGVPMLIKVDSRNIVTSNGVVPEVFDELTHPNFTTPTVYNLIDDGLNVHSMLHSQEEATFEQDVVGSKNEAIKMFNKSIEPHESGLKLFSGMLYSNCVIEEVELSSRMMFDEMHKRVLNRQIYAIKAYITLFGYVRQIFDKGSFSCIDDRVILSFDPGGYSSHHMDCGLLEINGEHENYCLKTHMAEFMNVGVSWYLLHGQLMQALQPGKKVQVSDLEAGYSSATCWANALITLHTKGSFQAGNKHATVIIQRQLDKRWSGNTIEEVTKQYSWGYVQPLGEGYLFTPTIISEGSGFIHMWSEKMFATVNYVDNCFCSADVQSFIWDPGLCVTFIYILEDKDVLERVGKRMGPKEEDGKEEDGRKMGGRCNNPTPEYNDKYSSMISIASIFQVQQYSNMGGRFRCSSIAHGRKMQLFFN